MLPTPTLLPISLPTSDLLITQSGAPLPAWFVYSGIVGAFLLTLSQLFRLLYAILKKPTLELRLTNEIFFRLINEGESLFANAVYLARNGVSEIKDIYFILEKNYTNLTSRKTFQLKPLRFGKKVRSGHNNTLPNHYFFTPSPLNFIGNNKVERQLCLAVISEYDTVIKGKFQEFNTKIQEYRQTLEPNIDGDASLWPQGYIAGIFSQLNTKVALYSQEIFNSIQLEDGDYKLTMVVSYKPISPIWPFSMEKRSSITFKMDGYRSQYQYALDKYLRDTGFQILFPKTNFPISRLPEYNPVEVEEV
jgi:hypothetical protein